MQWKWSGELFRVPKRSTNAELPRSTNETTLLDFHICETPVDLWNRSKWIWDGNKAFCFVPQGFLHTAKPDEDKSYIIVLLSLLTHFTSEEMSIPNSCLSERIETLQNSSESDVTFEVLVPHCKNPCESTSSCWTSEIVLEIAFLIRSNLSLMYVIFFCSFIFVSASC